jgi:hypothetical protein
MSIQIKSYAAGILALGLMAARPALAQNNPDYVHDRARYTLTMAFGWDSVAIPAGQAIGADFSVIAKVQGINGLAYISCVPGSDLPNVDSLAANYASVLGGAITKDSAGTKTLGKYAVHWQDFKYDSLPILSEMIRARAPFIPPLKNGSFRVYYLVSDGYVFTIAGIRVVASSPYPYPDIETGISTLKFKPLSGHVRGAVRNLGGGLWTRDGLLGGDWLRKHPALSVECFGTDGRFLGSAIPDGDAAWILPASREGMVVVIRARDGRSQSLLARP